MSDDQSRGELLAALSTEHFVQSTLAGLSTSEASSRSSLFLLTLSSTLVALGFVGIESDSFLPLASVAIPVLAVIGGFTELRLIGTSLQNFAALTRIARIRAYYAALHPDAPAFFGSPESFDALAETTTMLSVAANWRASLSTMATMIATVNSAVVGVGLACLAEVIGVDHEPAVALGVAAGIAHLVGFLVYQQRRFASSAPV